MEYRVIKNFPNYEVGEDGNIRNIKTKRIMKPYLQKGYYRITLMVEKKVKKSAAVHRLLALEFIPNPDNKPIIDHINRDKTDNRLCNLRWSTYKDNSNNVDSSKRNHKNRIKYEIGLLFCLNSRKWILKTKKVNKFYENINDAFFGSKNGN